MVAHASVTESDRSLAQMPPPPSLLDLTRALAPGGPGMLGTFACRTLSALDHKFMHLASCSVSTEEAWLNCWAYRTPGHSIFTAPLSRRLPEPSLPTDIGFTPTREVRGTTLPRRYRRRVGGSHRRTSPSRRQLWKCQEKYCFSPSLSPS